MEMDATTDPNMLLRECDEALSGTVYGKRILREGVLGLMSGLETVWGQDQNLDWGSTPGPDF
jgi:hypothetical protein